MLRLFKSRHPFLYLILLIYAFVLNGVLFFKDFETPLFEDSFLFNVIHFDIAKLSKPFLIILSIVLIYCFSLLINTIIIKYNLTREPSFLPAFIFITIQGIFPEMIIFGPAILGGFLILIIIYNLLAIFDIENAVQKIFFISFYVGIATMVYAPMAIYVILILMAIPILKRPNWWELAIVPFGFIIPIYLTGFGYYLFDGLDGMLDIFVNSFPYWSFNFPDSFYPHIIPFAYIFILSIIAFILYSVSGSNKLVRENRYQRVLMVFFFISLLIFAFSTVLRLNIGLFLLIPVSMLISRMYVEGKRKILDISYLLLILINIFVQWENF